MDFMLFLTHFFAFNMHNLRGKPLLYVGGLLILYIVIETAVRKGIKSSIIGQALEKS